MHPGWSLGLPSMAVNELLVLTYLCVDLVTVYFSYMPCVPGPHA